MQYFIQIRRADGSTYPTTVEADSLADARRKAQFVTEGGETVENITENTSDVGATTTQAMNNAFADGPTTLDELYRQFEIQRAQPESGINQQLGTGETGTPIRTTGTEATGVGFQPGAETQMRSVPNQTVDVGNLSSTYLDICLVILVLHLKGKSMQTLIIILIDFYQTMQEYLVLLVV